MKSLTIAISFFAMIALCGLAEARGQSTSKPFDPLAAVTSNFPKSIEINEKRGVLEFCPDNTCDGFVAKSGVSKTTLKDFAYLYIYFFSSYSILEEWRMRPEAKQAAARVLSKPEYRQCSKENSEESARCLLLDLSRNRRIRLLAIGYDERARNVTYRNISEELTKRGTIQKR